MYSENYNERFNNQADITGNSSNDFSDANMDNQTYASNYNDVGIANQSFFNNSSNEFDDDDIEMLWDDEEVTNNEPSSYVNLDNTQVVKTTPEISEITPEISETTPESQEINVNTPTEDITPNNVDIPVMPAVDMGIENNYINNKKANKLCIFAIISVLIYFIPIIGVYIFRATPGFFQDFFLVFSSFANIFPIVSLCLIVYTKTKYPFNKFVSILIYIYIAIFIIFVIIYLIYIFSCIGDIPTCFRM